ncbi:ubiquitin and ribosomal protein S27a [Coprinopsis cinerea AmutBmut pab1-1]|nr:ubiquitin and ribosomal protein S27a [Coprinopsis cinerea AmutBmut pab1-1]
MPSTHATSQPTTLASDSFNRSVRCEGCGKPFSTISALTRHEKTCPTFLERTGKILSRARAHYLAKLSDLPGRLSKPFLSRRPQASMSQEEREALSMMHDESSTKAEEAATQSSSANDLNGGHGTPPGDAPSSAPQTGTSTSPTTPIIHSLCESLRNKFGLKKQFYTPNGVLPNRNPDELVLLSNPDDQMDVCEPTASQEPSESPIEDEDGSGDKVAASQSNSFGPFPNKVAFEIGEWYWSSGPQKSQKDFEKLLEIITADDFSPDQLKGINWRKLFAHLGGNKTDKALFQDGEGEWIDDDGWKTTPIRLRIPFHSRQERPGNEYYDVGTFYHRSIVDILREKIATTNDERFFHYDPFKVFWTPSPDDIPDVRVYSELYNSDAFWNANKEIQDPLKNPECTLPRVLVGLMFWSDQTLLTSFGSSKIWPLYMCFGNESKYRRAKLSSNLCHHVAYFETLSDAVKDFITQRTGGALPDGLMSFLNRELLHIQWSIILDPEFIDAMENGIVITCPDGIQRRFYIRIFTYSADYPEKISLASMRRGACPCPRCLTPRTKFHNMGLQEDMVFREENPRVYGEEAQAAVRQARERIFDDGVAAYGTVVGGILNSHGLLPVENAFSVKLGRLGFDICSALVVDLLHEFEIGVWKDLFMHLVRILESLKPSSKLVHTLDRRYRLVPSFLQTIRAFTTNTSRMSRKAARDYEDALQCSIPVFEGLFPAPHEDIISKLLYLCCQWHALAKLRLHTDYTVTMLEETTVAIGNQFRLFMNQTCSSIETFELPREAEARQRRAAKKKANARPSELTGATVPVTITPEVPVTTPSSDQVEEDDSELPRIAPVAPPVPTGPDLRMTRSRTRNQTSTAQSTTETAPSVSSSRTKKSAKSRGTRKARGTKEKIKKIPVASEEGGERRVDSGVNETAGGSSVPDQAAPETYPGSSVVPQEIGDVPVLAETSTKANLKATGRRPKKLNLSTFKYHSMADYVKMIRQFGPCDLYSSEYGELHHRFPKSWYRRTNRQQVVKQISRIERRRARLRKLRQNNIPAELAELKTKAARSPHLPYILGASHSSSYMLSDFAQNGALSSDPACDNFIFKLKNFIHVNWRDALHQYILHRDPSYQGSPEDLDCPPDWTYVSIRDNRLYSHKTMRINYTTYDMKRDGDFIHVNSDNRNIMVLNPDFQPDEPDQVNHPYRYARVLGIFHVKLDVGKYLEALPGAFNDLRPMQFEALWVQWYEVKPSTSPFGLDRVDLVPFSHPHSTGFIRPDQVIRASHIVPRFSQGQSNPTGNQISSFARNTSDWNAYYVNRFVDRDMFMRYLWGHAIGHEYTRTKTVSSIHRDLIPKDALNQVEMDASLVHGEEYLSDDEMASIADSVRDYMEVDWQDGDDEEMD